MLPDGWGGKGKTSCALTGGAKIPLIARKLQVARDMQTRRRCLHARFFVPAPPNVTRVSSILTFLPPTVLTSCWIARSRRNAHTILYRTKHCRIRAGFCHRRPSDATVKTNSEVRKKRKCWTPPQVSSSLVHELNLARAPGFVQPRLQRPVHAQDHKPALARNRLQPVVLLACRRFRSKINVERPICVLLDPLRLASDCWEFLARLQHRARLRVVNRDGPEVIDRNVRRQMELIGFVAVERLLFGVQIGAGVIGADAYGRVCHSRGDAASIEIIHSGRVQLHRSVQLKSRISVREECGPDAVRPWIQIHAIDARVESDSARRGAAECG